ncbi:MAG: aminopeptidase P family N-terminal domain-containing protein, partial [Rickettsiales bacterium]|nr:aminopeptidase P family N-terminal domain-containing protein [Rickettsiales bacterium]
MTALKDVVKNIKKQGVDSYIQPVHDEFLNEYAPPCNRRVEWLSGFSGSAGAVAVTEEKAALFTDGRYTLQAQNEVDANVYELHNSGVTPPEVWLSQVLPEGSTVGYDAKLYTRSMTARMETILAPKGIGLKPVGNAVDAVWKGRPAHPATPLFVHEHKYAGEYASEKRLRVAEATVKAGADY